MIPEDVKTLARETLQLVLAEIPNTGSSIHERHEAKVGHIARAILTDREARSFIPAGYKLVPVEPTRQQQFDAAFNLSGLFGPDFVEANKDFALAVYAAMLSAAPRPPQHRSIPDAIDHINRLIVALKPFLEFSQNVEYDEVLDTFSWKSGIHRDAVSAWFGPSDFAYAAFAVNDTKGCMVASPSPSREETETRDPSALLLEAEKALEPDIRSQAINIICQEAEELGYAQEDVADFRDGHFDGDDLLTLQAVERALSMTRGGE